MSTRNFRITDDENWGFYSLHVSEEEPKAGTVVNVAGQKRVIRRIIHKVPHASYVRLLVIFEKILIS